MLMLIMVAVRQGLHTTINQFIRPSVECDQHSDDRLI
jgi:hypothetical protein